MAGSGLHKVLDLIYANKAVDFILSDKAIVCAVRAHLLVDAALNTLIASKAFNVDLLQGHYETYRCSITWVHVNYWQDYYR